MGIFKKLFGGKNKVEEKNNQKEQSILAKPVIKKQENYPALPFFKVHPDIKNYLWIADGPMKNYDINKRKKISNEVLFDGVRISFYISEMEEPSLIYTRLPISENPGVPERPNYFPTYGELTPEQRAVYWKLLENPYDPTIDIGYVFILYYGLERYLLTDFHEEIVDTILKLRDVHVNKSFQNYSANAIILTALYYKKPEIVVKFFNSLDKMHELNFSDNLYLLCKYSFDLPLTANDCIRLSKTVEFTKQNYIKSYPDLFKETLEENIQEKYKQNFIEIHKVLPDSAYKKLKNEEHQIFANVSINNATVFIPDILSSFKLKKEIYDLLDKTHEDVKKKLAEQRKAGIKPVPSNNKSTQKAPVIFDERQERILLDEYDEAEKYSLRCHFALMNLHEFYYRFRDLDEEYLNQCIYYCKEDIAHLPEIQESYVQEKTKEQQYNLRLGHVELKSGELSSVGKFDCDIVSFKRLAIIYEKKKQYHDGVVVCDKAIDYYTEVGREDMVESFTKRKIKLKGKIKD